MKKILALVLVFAMMLSLCACDSMDYKKAMALYDDGEYAEARAIFKELGDYEDSEEMVMACDYERAYRFYQDGSYEEACELFAQLGNYEDSEDMVLDCNYQIAMQLMDNSEYEEARAYFLELGDYEDAEQQAMYAARYMFLDYLSQQDKIINKVADSASTVVTVSDDGKIFSMYAVKLNGSITISLGVSVNISVTDTEALVVGLDDTYSSVAWYDAKASTHFDIATFSGQDVEWEDFTISGTNAKGQPYPQSATMLDILVSNAVREAVNALDVVLADSGLGLTMADIGFTSY